MGAPLAGSPLPQTTVVGFEGVSKSFIAGKHPIQALKAVTLTVRRGLVTGLIGPDGAGKTTLMRLTAGLLVPDEGHVTVLGFDSTRQSLAIQAAIGYMPQRFGLYEDLTVQENLDLYADLQGVPREERPGRFTELMHMTGLGPFTTRLAGRLSGGMKQKLGLACTLVRSPELLLLDEPTVGVDPVSRRELWSIVYRLVQSQMMSVLLSTAYLDEAERCDEVIMLHEGTLLDRSSPGELSSRMQGRTYAVTAAGMKKRVLQERLARCPGVTDAVIQGDGVRLVMETTEPPNVDVWSLAGATWKPVPPRFEDSFIAMMEEPRSDSAGGAAEGWAEAPVRASDTNLDSKIAPGGYPGEEEAHPHAGTRAYTSVRRKADDDVNKAISMKANWYEAPGGPVIEVRDVDRRFGDFHAVKGITFEVNRGEVFGLLGANGAGKSTTFRMLCGLLPASGGTLRVAGVDLRRAPAAARARIGYMSQKFSLYGNLSVGENLRFFGSAYGLSGTMRHEQITRVLDQFGLKPWLDATSANLPLGYKQRLALACALMHEPDILFLDEPTSGVDPLARREFWHRINTLAEQRVTVLVTTHFMEEAEYCDRLAIMIAGEILTIGSPAEIKERARTREQAEPTMEDTFISLIEAREKNDSKG
jgi:ABC-2 type transport system ATP-binding protein